MYSYSVFIGRSESPGLFAGQPVMHVAANVQARALHGSVVPLLEYPGPHAPLHTFANGPILPVDPVPEGDGVAGIEPRVFHLQRMEQEVADDSSVTRIQRPYGIGGDVVGRQAQQEIRVDQLPLMADLLVLVQSGERTPAGGTSFGKSPGSLPVRYTA